MQSIADGFHAPTVIFRLSNSLNLWISESLLFLLWFFKDEVCQRPAWFHFYQLLIKRWPVRGRSKICWSFFLIFISSCWKSSGVPGPNAAGQRPPAEIDVITVSLGDAVLLTELPGRLEASCVAQVRAPQELWKKDCFAKVVKSKLVRLCLPLMRLLT